MLTSPLSVNTSAAGNRRADMLFMIALAALFAGIMAVKIDLWRHDVLISDWVFMKNILWNTDLAGSLLYSEARFQQNGYPSYLNEHFSPMLIPLAFLYKATPFGDVLLLVLQGVCPCLVAVGLRAIGLRLFDDRRLAALMGIAFAFNPAILQPAIDSVYGFHSDSLSPPLIALAAWALLAKRPRTYFAALIAALLVKENVPAYGLIAGALLALSRQYRRQGIATAALSAGVFLLASRGVPLLTGLDNRNVGYAEKFATDLVALRPTFDYTRQELFYAIRYGGAFLPALACWPFLAMVVPDLLVFGQIAHANLSSWHMMPVLAILGVLAVVGSRRFVDGRWAGARLVATDPEWRRRAIGLYWAVIAGAAVVIAPVDLWVKHSRFRDMASVVDREALAAAASLIPASAGVATTTDIESYFAHRRVIFTTLTPRGLDYAVTNSGAIAAPRCSALPEVCAGDRELISTLAERTKSGGVVEIFASGGVRAYRLRSGGATDAPPVNAGNAANR
jgi:GNAT superfamily N-acetyltransferase